MNKRSNLLILALGIVFGLSVALVFVQSGRQIFTGGGEISRALDPPAVLQQIRGLNQLVTVKYSIQKAVALEEQKIPVGRERILLFVQAEVAAGIDLGRIGEKDVKILDDGVVAISLPRADVTSVVIDDTVTKVWDRSVTWWTPWVPYNQDLERQARLAARDEVEKAARDMGILNQAQSNAETAIRTLLLSTGMKEVKFLENT